MDVVSITSLNINGIQKFNSQCVAASGDLPEMFTQMFANEKEL